MIDKPVPGPLFPVTPPRPALPVHRDRNDQRRREPGKQQERNAPPPGFNQPSGLVDDYAKAGTNV